MIRQLALLLAFGGAILFVVPATAQAEVVREFDSTYEVQTDGTVLVVEKIHYDFENVDRHGIYRLLETDHVMPASVWYKKRSVGVDVIGVERAGVAEPYVVSNTDGGLEIKIGDPDQTISGDYLYTIHYKLSGALSYLPDGRVEIYWNATGNQWPVAIDKVKVQVTGSPALMSDQAAACYVGAPGSSQLCDLTRGDSGGNVVTFTTNNLMPGEQLTFAHAISPEMVAVLVRESIKWNYLFVPLTLVMVLGLFYRARRVYRHHIKDETIVAQYEPYKELLPMYTGTVYDGRLDFADITAGIVYLAEQGFIKIKQTEEKVLLFFNKRDYMLTLLRPISEAPDDASKWILHLLFDPQTKTGLMISLASLVKSDAPAAPAEVGKSVLMSELLKNRSANSRSVRKMQEVFVGQLLSDGYLEKPKNALELSSGKYRLIIILWLIVAFFTLIFVGVGAAGFSVIGLVLGLATGAQKRQTSMGYEAKQHLLGFKEFLSVTDKERFDFHNAPERSPELFMKYLPFAIALGVEQKWAEVFGDMMIPSPEWYESAHVGAFAASDFTADMKTFSTAVSSSNSTSSSGSSGGGSAGGGGGGGGGGSW